MESITTQGGSVTLPPFFFPDTQLAGSLLVLTGLFRKNEKSAAGKPSTEKQGSVNSPAAAATSSKQQ